MRVEEKNSTPKKFQNGSKGKPKYSKPTFKSKNTTFKPKFGPLKNGSAQFKSKNPTNTHFKPGNRNKTPFKPNKNGKKYDVFLENAKKFGKMGKYGFGAIIDKEMHAYLISVLESIRSKSKSPEQTATIANRFLKRMSDEEIVIATNQIGCQALVDVIAFAEAKKFEHLLVIFRENLDTLHLDPFASRVLCRLVETAFLRAVGAKGIVAEQTEIEPLTKKFKLPHEDRFDYNVSEQFTDKHRRKCSEFIKNVSQFALDNLETIIFHHVGGHFLRYCVLALVGLYLPTFANKKNTGGFCILDDLVKKPFDERNGVLITGSKAFHVPSEWIDLMKEFVLKLEKLPRVCELPYLMVPSVTLQFICLALSHVDKKALMTLYKKLLKKSFTDADVTAIIARLQTERKAERTLKHTKDASIEQKDESADEEEQNDSDEETNFNEDKKEDSDEGNEDDSGDDNKDDSDEDQENQTDVDQTNEIPEDWPSVFGTLSSRRLLTTLMIVGGPEIFLQIYTDFLAGRLTDLAMKIGTSFIVQGLLHHISDKSLFNKICNDLFENMPKLPKSIVTHVAYAISGACLRLKTKQNLFISALQKCLNCDDEEAQNALFACVLQMKPREDNENENVDFILEASSRIIQNVLNFEDPSVMVNSILHMQPTNLAECLKKPLCFGITNAFFKSDSVDGDSRNRLIDYFKGYYHDLGTNRFGSDVVRKLFTAGNLTQKKHIVEELVEGKKTKPNYVERLLWNRFSIEAFITDPEQWKTLWSGDMEDSEQLAISPITKELKKNKNTKSAQKPTEENVSATQELDDEELMTSPKSKAKPKLGDKKTTASPQDKKTTKSKSKNPTTTPNSKTMNMSPTLKPKENGTPATPNATVKKTKAKKRPAPA